MDADDTSKDRQWAELFDALSHPARIMILKALSEEPVGFSDLKKKLDIESSGHLQHHLSKLGGLIKTDNFGKYTLSDEGKDALLSVETVEKVAESDDKNKKLSGNGKKNIVWKSALVLLSLLLLTSSVIAVYENSRLVSFQSQLTSLQNQIDARDATISQLNESLKWAELTLNIKPLASNYLTTLPTTSSNGNITKIFLEFAEARYLSLSRFIIFNASDTITAIPLFSSNATSSNPYLGQNPLFIQAVVRNDYTPTEANPNDPYSPIGNSTSRYVSFVTLTVRLYSQNGSVIQESNTFTYQDQAITTLFRGETKSVYFKLNPTSPYIDHYEIYVSYLSSYAMP